MFQFKAFKPCSDVTSSKECDRLQAETFPSLMFCKFPPYIQELHQEYTVFVLRPEIASMVGSGTFLKTGSCSA